RREHPRTGDDLLLERLLESDIGVAGAFGAEIADQREAGIQDRAEVVVRPADAQGERFFQNLIVPGRFVVGMQKDVRVRIDQAGEERRVWQIDRAGIGRRLDLIRRPDRFDLLAANEHDPAVMRFERDAVEYAGGTEDYRGG